MAIPKVIHYCWFGRNPLPESARKCVASWRKYFPEYEIMEWNEANFDVHGIPYTSEAYECGKYAFVSDYARYKILHENGGVYFDTDVEVIRDMSTIIANGPYLGFEINPGAVRPLGAVNPGLGMAAVAGMKLYENVLRYYESLHFILPDGTQNIQDAVVNITTNELVKLGLKPTNEIQTIEGVTVYPAEYFNPFDDNTGRLRKTDRTYTIHWYSKTWMKVNPIRQFLSRQYHKFQAIVGK